ncbi:MAG: tetratricopeptide repeat protein [Candidatus Thorarchaeota archaeon]|jgi:tetratricopeptide (TPR) repeat protein
MKPMGTITKYYPFIDEETKSILDSLMDESSSYYDFVQRLCKVVLQNEVPINLAYITAVQVWWCRIEEIMGRICEKYKDVLCIRPWGHPHQSSLSDQVRYHDDVVEEIERAMETSLSDWIVTELHLLHTFFHWPLHGDIPSFLEPLEKAKNLIESNPVLSCFESLICTFEGWAKYLEGNSKSAIIDFQRGQQLAEIHDDSLYKYMSSSCLADLLRTVNTHESLSLYEELYTLAQDLEVPFFVSEVLNDSSIAYETAGEYDLAISSHIESVKIWREDDTSSLYLSRIYATLGNAQLALEWANRSFEYTEHLEFPILYLRKARALALSNGLEEAEQNLDTAHSLIMKAGNEIWLSNYYHVSGVIELKRGNNLIALDILEQAQEIIERHTSGIDQNIVLHDLAKAEIALASQTMQSDKEALPGKWLSKLENHAIEHDLPGIRMQAALLRSEFYQNHGQLKDAQAILQDALNITDSRGVATLRKRINNQIQELSRLMKDKELVS